MRRLILAAVFSLFFAATAFAGGFEDGNAKYRAGDFKGAAAAYEPLIAAGEGTAAVYYNLGNTYFRLGQKGKAVAHYRRALRLSPRDADTRWNLQILKSTLPDKIEASEDNT